MPNILSTKYQNLFMQIATTLVCCLLLWSNPQNAHLALDSSLSFLSPVAISFFAYLIFSFFHNNGYKWAFIITIISVIFNLVNSVHLITTY